MKIIIVITLIYDVVELTFDNKNQIKSIIIKFDKYIHDISNDHPYWVYKDKKKVAPEVNTDSLVWWLNNIYQNDNNFSVIISRDNDLSKLAKRIIAISYTYNLVYLKCNLLIGMVFPL